MTQIPNFLYGTAWKEEKTSDLVFSALQAGFRGIDTANQRKHYFEAAVGDGLIQAYDKLNIKREDLFLQTKFTYSTSQDHRLPFQANDSYDKQVVSSFESSLENLQTDYLDSLILHGPSSNHGVSSKDKLVWTTMESLVAGKKVNLIGVSNIRLQQLQELCEYAKFKPAFVQNRCFAQTQWDKKIREYCLINKITYQGFSLLTANRHELAQQDVQALSLKYNKNIAQIVFKFAQQIGMLPLTGTSSTAHMQEDLEIEDFMLSNQELLLVENIHQAYN